MPLVRSSPLLEVSASSWKIARYGAFPRGLSVALTCPQRTKANKQAIESLAPRVKELAERLCEPVGEGDVKERERRTRLERLVHTLHGYASVEPDTGIRRKLQEVLEGIAPLEKQGRVEGFFNNTENAAQLGNLVEGIRDAMMDYQVRTSNSSPLPRLTLLPDFVTTRDLRKAARDLLPTTGHL